MTLFVERAGLQMIDDSSRSAQRRAMEVDYLVLGDALAERCAGKLRQLIH
jgi:hypothetical protein